MPENKPGKNEEIDLFYFLKPAITFAGRVKNFLLVYLSWLNRAKFLALTIFVLLVALGFSARYFLPRAYRTEGMFVSNTLPNSYFSLMIERLNELNKNGGNENILAKQMQISDADVKDIRKIAMTPISEVFVNTNKDTAIALFRVDLVLRKMDKLDTIQSGILRYLENSDYARKRKVAKRQSLMALKQNLRTRILSLDTLKNIVNNSITPRSEGKGIVFGEPLNPVLVYDAETDFYNKELAVTEELALMDNVEVVQPFSQRNDYNYPDVNKLMIPVLICALIASLILAPMYGRSRIRRQA